MYARGTNKVASCAISGVVYTVTLALSNIWLLLLVKMGIPGYLMSTVLAYLVPSIYLFIVVKDKSFNLALLDKKLMNNILKLSIPLIPTAILWTLMNLADKYAILWTVGSSGNGIYAVAHKIPTIISVIYGIFQQAWQLTTFELDSQKERSTAYSKIFELLTSVMFVLAAALIVLNRIYIICFCDASYIMAWTVSPILMYSAVLNCISGLLGSNYLIMHDTKSALKVTAVGAVINVILNFVLVPVWGLYGAAIATCIGYLYMVVKKYYDTSKFTPLNIKINRFFLANAILILMCCSVMVRRGGTFYISNVILGLGMMALYKEQFHNVADLILDKIYKRKKK